MYYHIHFDYMNRFGCIVLITATATRTMNAMRRALRTLAIRIEEIKYEYIEAERNNNAEEMETLSNKLYVMEAFYNHHTAIVNGDVANHGGYSQEDLFVQNIQNDTLNNTESSSEVSENEDFLDFKMEWKKLHDDLGARKKDQSSAMGLCFICFCDVREDELVFFSCGHSVCIGECGARLPKPFCPAAACNKSIEDIFDKFKSSSDNKKRKADEAEIPSFEARMTELRARGVVASAAPVVPLAAAPPIPEIIVIDDSDDEDDAV